MRGECVINIGGGEKHLKYGVISLPLFEQVFGKNLFMVADLLKSDNPGEILETIIKIVHVGLLARKSKNNLPVDYSLDMLHDWIEQLVEDEQFEQIKDKVMPAFTDGLMVFSKMTAGGGQASGEQTTMNT